MQIMHEPGYRSSEWPPAYGASEQSHQAGTQPSPWVRIAQASSPDRLVRPYLLRLLSLDHRRAAKVL